MNMKFATLTLAALAAGAVVAGPTSKSGRGGSAASAQRRAQTIAAAEAEETAGMSDQQKRQRNKIKLDMPKTGRNNATAVAPQIQGASFVNVQQKERRWILLEAKYANPVRQERITFTWHVLLDMKTADKDVRGSWDDPDLPNPPSRYSYFTTSVTYENVPGNTTIAEHAASVCLAPSYLECFGEPKAIGIEVTNKDGEIMDGGFGVESEIPEIKSCTPHMGSPKDQEAAMEECAFWKNPKIMDATYKKTGAKYVTQRQGLLDRSKTIWALVKPNYFEQVAQ